LQKQLLKLLALVLLSIPSLPAADIPWFRLSLIWSSSAADLATSRYAIGDAARTTEANPILATNTGQISTGKYVALVTPIDVFLSYVTVKHPKSRALRIATFVSASVKFGIAAHNVTTR
jgi:hypothetical protein